MKKIFGTFFIIIFLVGLGLLAAGFFPIRYTFLSPSVQRILQIKGRLDSCAVGSVSLSPFHQIIITDVYARKHIGGGKQLVYIIPKIHIKHRFLYFCARWKQSYAISQNIFKPLRLRTTWDGGQEQILRNLYTIIDQIDTVLLSGIRSISVDGCAVTCSDSGKTIFHIHDLNGGISSRLDSVPDLTVKCSAPTVHINDLVIGRPVLQFRILGPGCSVKKMEGKVYGGRYKVEADLDLKNNTITEGTVELQKIDCAAWYASLPEAGGTLKGEAEISLRLENSGTVFSQVKGTGEFKATDVVADNLNFIQKVVVLAELTKLNHLTFPEVKGTFIVRDARIWSDNCKGEGDPLSVKLAGWIHPEDGTLQINTRGTFEAYYKDSIPNLIWNSLLPEDEGRRSCICTISGSTSSPSVSIDRQIARRAVKNVFQSIGEELKGMFGKKRKKAPDEE
jgi:hypothetical protein